jgi:perosamine synthetase
VREALHGGVFRGRLAPKRPLLSWRAFVPSLLASPFDQVPQLGQIGESRLVSSGRAALYQALALLDPSPDSRILVPTYHCPTMVAPVLLAGAQAAYFPINAKGLPDLARIEVPANTLAMIVPHFFGRAQSLAEVRQWCQARQIVLIEDCAHCYFGQAGELPVGAWGDYAIASVTKFMPVPEAGLLISARLALPKLALQGICLKAQLKAVVDLFELASQFATLFGLNTLLRGLFRLKNGRPSLVPDNQRASETVPVDASAMMQSSDMARVKHRASWASRWVMAMLPRRRIIARRQENFARYQACLQGGDGFGPLFASESAAGAPYVFPLWIESASLADYVYQGLRRGGHAVFRWDRQWPGTPTLIGDHGSLWSRQVLQLLCHQDLTLADIEAAAAAAQALLSEARHSTLQ